MNQQDNQILLAPGFLDGNWYVYGDRKNCSLQDGVLSLRDCRAATQNREYENLDLRFSARAPETEREAQIWAGVRGATRDFSYMIGLRGGNNKQLYLARLGAVGHDKMLGLRTLEWCPTPGTWYSVRIVCAGSRIAVYLGDETQPRLLCTDADAPFHKGGICLGGGSMTTEYKDVSVKEVPENALDSAEIMPDYLENTTLPPQMREILRRSQRGQYRPFVVPALPRDRMELNLDGQWLFIPEQEAGENPQAIHYDDSKAHVMQVPASWTPLQGWLEGENMGQLNKGMSDTCFQEELQRCGNQTFDYANTMTAWYRHYLDLPEGIEQKQVILDFEAIAMISTVYCNGRKVHENIGMFTPQTIDLGDYVHSGRNVLAVEVGRRLPEEEVQTENVKTTDDYYVKAREENNELSTAPVSDCVHNPFRTEDIPHGFYMNHPGGIWRSVRLTISNPVAVRECWFRPALDGASLEVAWDNKGKTTEHAELFYSLTHKTTGEFLCGGRVETAEIAPGEEKITRFSTPRVTPLLWAPGKPNLYRLELTLMHNGNVLDTYREQVGFRTVKFEGSTLIFNGQPLWVRGSNHMPAHMRPNDRALAERYMHLALEHNVLATRTHVAPWGSTWLDAADEAGVMVSLEGTWPWLMISEIPSRRAIEIWQEELRQLFHRHRNRPSLFLITMNNEMRFYLGGDSDETVIEKGSLLQPATRYARQEFPDLPLVCDSSYFRAPAVDGGYYPGLAAASGRLQRIMQAHHFDDGDMDDPHCYFGWYEPGFFHYMHGEFGRDLTVPGRPCMSQECSLGYAHAEDGSCARSYLFSNQTPQTMIGKRAYEHNSPWYFQNQLAFQIQGMLEMFRRVEHDRTCGVLLFAFESWFYNHHDSRRVQAMLPAQRLKMAYQPVLASASLFGRHFYAGRQLETRVTLINDSLENRTLQGPEVEARILSGDRELSRTVLSFADLPYYQRAEQKLVLDIPEQLPDPRTEAVLELRVLEWGRVISRNTYDILLGSSRWAEGEKTEEPVYYLDEAAQALLKNHRIVGTACADPVEIIGKPGRLIVGKPLSGELAARVRHYAQAGGHVVLLNQKALPEELLKDKQAEFVQDRQEIVTMNIPENSLFAGLGELDLRWFPEEEQPPYAAWGRYHIDRFDPDFCVLGETLQWHSYMGKSTEYQKFGGAALFSLKMGSGAVLVSSLRTDACDADPAASRIIGNLMTWDFCIPGI